MDAHSIEVAEIVPASRKLSRDDAVELARGAREIIVARGKKVSEFPGGKAGADVVDAMLGPTGNLRAPCIKAGKTLLVGFNEEVYARVFG